MAIPMPARTSALSSARGLGKALLVLAAPRTRLRKHRNRTGLRQQLPLPLRRILVLRRGSAPQGAHQRLGKPNLNPRSMASGLPRQDNLLAVPLRATASFGLRRAGGRLPRGSRFGAARYMSRWVRSRPWDSLIQTAASNGAMATLGIRAEHLPATLAQVLRRTGARGQLRNQSQQRTLQVLRRPGARGQLRHQSQQRTLQVKMLAQVLQTPDGPDARGQLRNQSQQRTL